MIPPRIRAARMAEAELEAEVQSLMERLGLWGYHPRISVRDEPGWPDWTIFGKGILFRELKRQQERPTPAQRRTGILIRRAGGDWAVWKPSDLLDGTIESQLKGIA